jgi:hypothetical protein
MRGSLVSASVSQSRGFGETSSRFEGTEKEALAEVPRTYALAVDSGHAGLQDGDGIERPDVSQTQVHVLRARRDDPGRQPSEISNE